MLLVSFKVSSAVVAETFLSFTTPKHMWQNEGVIICEQHFCFYTHAFLEKLINFQKFCGSFLLSKKKCCVCIVFISEYP